MLFAYEKSIDYNYFKDYGYEKILLIAGVAISLFASCYVENKHSASKLSFNREQGFI